MEEPRHPFRVLIFLEHSRTLINGLAAKVLALNILQNFDGLKALFAPVVEHKLTSRLMGRGLFLCRKCKRQTSITSGTLFHGSHGPGSSLCGL